MRCKVSDEADDCARRNEKCALRKINGRAVHNRIYAPITASADYTRGFDIIPRHRWCIIVLEEEECEGVPPRAILKAEIHQNFCPRRVSIRLFAKDDRGRENIVDWYLFARLDRNGYAYIKIFIMAYHKNFVI